MFSKLEIEKRRKFFNFKKDIYEEPRASNIMVKY